MPIAVTGPFVTHGYSNALSISHFWPWGLTPWSKFPKLGRGLQQAPLRHLAKFQPDLADGLRDVRCKNVSVFGLREGANPWAKVHQRGDDLSPY